MGLTSKKEFKSLTKTEQVVNVLNSGKELLTRNESDHFIKLYLFNNIFVEIWYELHKTTILKVGTPSKKNIMLYYNINKQKVEQLLLN